MAIREEILNIIKDWADKHEGVFHYNEETGEETYIGELIDEIFHKYDITEYDYDDNTIFENCGCTLKSFSVAWIENGKLQTILNEEIELY